MNFTKKTVLFATITVSITAITIYLSGCASTRPNGTHETRVERDAIMIVEQVDVPNRLVTVREASGDTLTVYVDPSVKSFPQASVGDRVRVRYVESMAFQLTRSGDTQGIQVTEATARPEPGRPAGATATEVKATVRIDAVEQAGQKVTFTGPRGRRAVLIDDPALRDYASKLRPGDKVEVTYKEALALSLEKVKT